MPKIIDDDKVYRAAIQVVIKNGYARAKTKQIADAAGISEVSLFRKYESKAELVKQAIIATAVQMDFTSASHYTGDVAVDLVRIVEAYQDLSTRHGQFITTLIGEIARHPELGDLLDAPLQLMEDVADLMARYQSEGILRPELPLQAVAALLGPLMITNMIRQANASVSLPMVDAARHVELFLNGRRALQKEVEDFQV
jgi:AcrR family transcriptional regulator